MPAKAPWICCGLILIWCASAAAAPNDGNDRYAQWRRERTDQPSDSMEPARLEPEAAREMPRDEDNAAVTPQEVTADAGNQESLQSPLKSRQRKLPMRFELAHSNGDGSRVVRASATSDTKSLPLRPRQKDAPQTHRAHPEMPSIVTLIGSLAVVVGLFMIVAWAMRRSMPKQAPLLPREALEVLGRQRLTGKQEVHLVRLGNKLLLMSIMPGVSETLAEITDPVEVDRLTGLCYQAHPHSSSKRFQQTFQQFAQERPAQRTTTSSRHVVDKLDLSMYENAGKSRSKVSSHEAFDG